jgi:thiol-disulfide isomerase/thioredoxin
MKINSILFLITISLGLNAQPSVQNFSLTNVVDSKTVSLDQFASNAGVVVLFTSNECPFDNYYKDRIKEMISAYAGKVQFLLINSYIESEESAEKMAIHYTDLNVPYLSDKDQVVMNALGAKKSPEVFLLKNSGGKFITAYSGAIDNNPQVAKDVNQKFLKDAIDKMLGDQKIEVTNNRAVGCSMRRK